MRVLIVGNQFPNPNQVFIHNKIIGLSKRGIGVLNLSYNSINVRELQVVNSQHNTNILTLTINSFWLFLKSFLFFCVKRPSNFKIVYYKSFSGHAFKIGLNSFRKNIILLYLATKVDVVHFEWNTHAATHADVLKLLNKPFVVSIRGRGITSQPAIDLKLKSNLAIVFSQATLIHSVSSDLVNYLVGYPHNADAVRIIYPAINLNAIKSKKLRIWSDFRIITVAHYRWKKNLPVAIHVVSRLIKEGCNITYDIVGEGPEREHLQYIIDELNISERVKLHGHKPNEWVLEQLAQSDIFLMPSIQEGFCNSVIEAQATGLPCIVTDADGLAENIEDNITGFVVSKFNSDEMYNKLKELVINENLRTTFGLNGKLRAKNRYDADVQIEKFIQLYGDAKSLFSKFQSNRSTL
jgi:colanic acid/amylovoran biosynthesis glycosyltransferase